VQNFVIVTAVMLSLFIVDFRPLLQGREIKAAVFYCVLSGVSYVLIALLCVNRNLPSLF